MREWCQRWSSRQHSWRRRSEGGFDSTRYDVAPIAKRTARAFVETHHYSGSYPASRFQYGLYEREALVGVLSLTVPMQQAVLTRPFPHLEPYAESLELGRLVLADRVPANAESWFTARCFELAAREGIRGVISFSDPQPRSRADGALVMPGHVGIVYQALNALYLGRGRSRTLLLLPDGTVLSDRSSAKVKPGHRGAGGVERLLVAWGATPRTPGQTGEDWMREALEAVPLRRLRHGGNHRYAFRLGTRSDRRGVVIGLACAPYPKVRDGYAALPERLAS